MQVTRWSKEAQQHAGRLKKGELLAGIGPHSYSRAWLSAHNEVTRTLTDQAVDVVRYVRTDILTVRTTVPPSLRVDWGDWPTQSTWRHIANAAEWYGWSVRLISAQAGPAMGEATYRFTVTHWPTRKQCSHTASGPFTVDVRDWGLRFTAA